MGKSEIQKKIDSYKQIELSTIELDNVTDDLKSLANNFPKDLTNLSDKDLMLLWGSCLSMAEYSSFLSSRYDVKTKVADSVRKYVESLLLLHISTHKVVGITSREQRAAWVKVQEEYTSVEKEYLECYNNYSLYLMMKELYDNKIFICSRELTRRQITVDTVRKNPTLKHTGDYRLQ